MKNLPAILFLIVSVFVSNSCRIEEDDYIFNEDCIQSCNYINGQLMTGDGSESLSGAYVELEWHKGSNIFGGGLVRNKAVSISDVTGYYELKFQIREDEIDTGYYIVKYYPGKKFYGCTGEHEFGIGDIPKDTIMTYNYGIPYKASLTVRSKGAENMAINDYFSFSALSPSGIDFNSACGFHVSWSNEFPDREFTYDVAALQPVVLKTVRRINEERFPSYDTLYLDIGEHVEYVVEL